MSNQGTSRPVSVINTVTTETGQLPDALDASGGVKVAIVAGGGGGGGGGGSVTQGTSPWVVSGTVTANAGSGPFPVSDNSGSLTVDAPVGTPVWVRLSDGAAAFVGQKTMANSLPVTLASDQSAVPVSGTFWQATQPVSISGTLAENQTQIAGTAIDVNSGNKSAGTQRVVLATDQPQLTNALKVDGSAVTQPVSGTFWPATQPVSGTVTANAGTGPWPVTDNSGSLTVDAPVATPLYTRLSDGTSALTTTSGALKVDTSGIVAYTASTATLSTATTPAAPATPGSNTTGICVDCSQMGRVVFEIAGTYGLGAQFTIEASIDGTNFISAYSTALHAIQSSKLFNFGPAANATQAYEFMCGGFKYFRTYLTVAPPSGSISVSVNGTPYASSTQYTSILAGQSGTWTVQPGNTANTTAWKVDASSVAIPVTDNSGSLTVDGTVTANPATGQGKTLLFASVSVASSGDNSIVAADASNKIKLVSYTLVADAAVNVKWRNATTDISGAMAFAANGGAAAISQPSAHLMETSVNSALQLNLSSAVGVRGHISYFKEP